MITSSVSDECAPDCSSRLYRRHFSICCALYMSTKPIFSYIDVNVIVSTLHVLKCAVRFNAPIVHISGTHKQIECVFWLSVVHVHTEMPPSTNDRLLPSDCPANTFVICRLPRARMRVCWRATWTTADRYTLRERFERLLGQLHKQVSEIVLDDWVK